jgi:hypothetical protein
MFLLMMISIIRYVTVLRGSATKRRFRRNNNLAVLISWLLGLVFAVPPLFKWNRFIPEGLGFHCGLDWSDPSTSSHIYLFSTMVCVYFIPLVILSSANMYVYCVIRRLLSGADLINQSEMIVSSPIHRPPTKQLSSAHVSESKTSAQSWELKSIRSPRFVQQAASLTNRHRKEPIQIQLLMRLNHLQADRRFALATIFLVAEYLLSWTPYACVALLYLFDVTTIIEHPMFVTICAFIAKVSMMINPLIYIVTIKTNQVKVIFFCQRCTCIDCRLRETQAR